jgi:hypothetical protein
MPDAGFPRSRDRFAWAWMGTIALCLTVRFLVSKEAAGILAGFLLIPAAIWGVSLQHSRTRRFYLLDLLVLLNLVTAVTATLALQIDRGLGAVMALLVLQAAVCLPWAWREIGFLESWQITAAPQRIGLLVGAYLFLPAWLGVVFAAVHGGRVLVGADPWSPMTRVVLWIGLGSAATLAGYALLRHRVGASVWRGE